jgi:hypothetical protein
MPVLAWPPGPGKPFSHPAGRKNGIFKFPALSAMVHAI